MPEKTYVVASGFTLEGAGLDQIAVNAFSDLGIDCTPTNLQVGSGKQGLHTLQTKPTPPQPTQPSFVAVINKGDMKLAKWFKDCNPNDSSKGKWSSLSTDMTFTFVDEGSPAAQWQLKGAFPMSYQVSGAEAGSTDWATETIKLACTEIVREQ